MKVYYKILLAAAMLAALFCASAFAQSEAATEDNAWSVLVEMFETRSETIRIKCADDAGVKAVTELAKVMIAGFDTGFNYEIIAEGIIVTISNITYPDVTYAFCADRDAVIDFTREVCADRTESFTIYTNEALFDELYASNATELYAILGSAGVSKCSIYSNDYYYRFRITITEYAENFVYCTSEAQLVHALAGFAAAQTQAFTIGCEPALYERMTADNFSAFSSLGARCRISERSLRYFSSTCHLQMSEVVYIDPQIFAVCMTEDEVTQAIRHFKIKGMSDFYIAADPELFQSLLDNSYERLYICEGLAQVTASSHTRIRESALLHFSEVEFADAKPFYCVTEDDITAAIRASRNAGPEGFMLIMTQELYKRIYADFFAQQTELELEAGLYNRNMLYSSNRGMILYTETDMVDQIIYLESVPAVYDYLKQATSQMQQSAYLHMTKEVYDKMFEGYNSLMDSGTAYLTSMLTNFGVANYDIQTYSDKKLIIINSLDYFPGVRILNAERSGDFSSLTLAESTAHAVAKDIAEQARAHSDDPLYIAKYIHDHLCDIVTYRIDDDSENDDNLIGALLYGEANCDGYTDAFYLIGSLAGLNVRYQHGDSIGKDLFSFGDDSTHIWNLLEINGGWYMVDVTWADTEEHITYTWFNAGRDRAEKTHAWTEEVCIETLADVTDPALRFTPELFVGSDEELAAAIRQMVSEDEHLFDLYCTGDYSLNYRNHDILNILADVCPGREVGIVYSWNDELKCMKLFEVRY